MQLVVGLGNPGEEYAGTRHNVGFQVVDELCRRHGLTLRRTRWRARAANGSISGTAVVLLEPMTYMNDSGYAVRRAADFYKISPGSALVVCDDIDLPLGMLRMRAQGSAGGHNGVRDVIAHLQTDAFPRLKIGVGRPPGPGATGHVLGPFRPDERPVIVSAIGRAADAVELCLREGALAAMNRFNGPANILPS